MSRLTYAAEQLRDQVVAEKKKAIMAVEGDPDGLDVSREISFDKDTSKWLAPLMEIIGPDDDRIESVNLTEAGYLHVTFSSEVGADDRTPFPLDQVASVLKAD